MIKLFLAIIMIALNACSTQQTKTTYATYQPPVAIDQASRAIASQQVKHHSIPPEKNHDESNEIAQQDKLLPRIASYISYIKQGVASWYGPGFHGKKTATGEIFDMYAMTAAHKTLPIPSYAQVTNLENNRSIIVRINDRGPFVRNRDMDLSYAAAKHLDMEQDGTGSIEIKVISDSQALPQLQQIAAEQAQEVYLQVGSFGSVKKAMNLKNKIAANNLPEPDIRSSTYKKSTLYKVQMGPIDSTAKANELNQQLEEIGITDTQFVTESKQSDGPRVTM
ncbi:MAG: septal ring lytic transglycosylase RlpA family protein [Methylococcales bacterium]|nr:septal ring lytic transglycosylase RlpA family protein [Methylococcales bacterium]MDD5631560.1 septal ring lytic transglycosylase RlpA family protein [Methylococcales bacterium]